MLCTVGDFIVSTTDLGALSLEGTYFYKCNHGYCYHGNIDSPHNYVMLVTLPQMVGVPRGAWHTLIHTYSIIISNTFLKRIKCLSNSSIPNDCEIRPLASAISCLSHG